MIRIEDLSCGYGQRRVLDGISATLRRGQMVGLLGPNGSGKTTLMSAAGGILPAMGGRVQLQEDGGWRDVLAMSAKERARRIAFVPQKASAAFPLKCSSVVLMGRYPHLSAFSGYGREDIAVARQCMERAGVGHLWERPTDAVSGGEFQRVLFARALAQETDVMFLDEPSASLDMSGTVQLFDLLRGMADGGGLVFVTVHDLNLAALYCDRVIFLKNGAVAAEGETGTVFDEQILSGIYETRIRVGRHPVTGAPQVHMVPRHAGAVPDGVCGPC